MIELECPNCNCVLNVQKNKDRVVCQKCLVETGKRFIMIESHDNPNHNNLGDGFFEVKE
jgi:reverse gyrase